MKKTYIISAFILACLNMHAQGQYNIELPGTYVEGITSPSPGSYIYPSPAGEELTIGFKVHSTINIETELSKDIESKIASCGASGFLDLSDLSVSVQSRTGTLKFRLGPNTSGTVRGIYFKAGSQQVCYMQYSASFEVSPKSTTLFPGESLDIRLSLSSQGGQYTLKKNGATVMTKTGTGGSLTFPVTVSYGAGRTYDTYTVSGEGVSNGTCRVNYYEAITGKYARADRSTYKVDRHGGSVTVKCTLSENEQFNDISEIVSAIARGVTSWWPSGSVTMSDYEYSEGWCDVRFDFSENTSSSSRSYPSVFIFDSSGSQVQFVQEGRSPQLDGISWISGRRFTSEEGRTWMTDIAYYDGLGRPEQTVEKWSTPDYGDIVTLREYDAAGLETILWNATEVGSDGLRKTPPAIRSSAIAEYGDDNPYTETVYENSAMDRVSSQWLQGEANRDAGASTEVEYGSSAADEILYGTVSDDGTLALRNAVPAGAFHKTVTTDPDGHRVAEYTDSEGRTVLQRSGTGSDEADTYYFYDLRGHLRMVMSPEGSSLLEAGSAYTASSDVMRRYAYTYRYDSRGRAVERRLPGRETEYYVYDAGDNAVGYQDGNLREDGQWMISGYDAFHREVWSGTVEESRSRASLQALSDSGGGLETLKGGSTFAMYSEREYDRKKSGQSSSLNYSSPASDWSYPDESRLKGYLTYERLAVLGEEGVPTGDYAERSYYYDRRGRAQQMVETNPAGVGSRLSWRYDFAGNVTEEYEQSGGVIMQTDYSYDSRGRLSGEQVRISSETVESVYGYDSRGMVNEVSRTAGDHTHTESMGYTVQGWQSVIESTPFSMDLSYWAPVISGVSPSYGGNITGMELRYGQTGSATSVGFSYDSRSRLTRSVWSGSGKYTEEGITYDLNGNLMTLKRYGDGSLIDNLSYSYTGDQIQSISGGTGNYSYDSNGNMTGDGYHGLTLEYNTLGKVSRVKSGTSAKVSYTYLADGTKVSALDASGNGLLYSGAMVFRKDGSVRSAESVGYSGGRFVADASGVLRPQIHVLDHLGSVRAIVDKSGNVVERDSYYPYGERWNDGSVEQADNRYRYNGKESQSDFGLPYLDYGARLYDPATGRWLTQDPLSEKYYGISPYAFCAGNPMKYVDMDGMDIWEIDSEGYIRWREASEGHRLYSMTSDGYRSQDYITVRDRSILDALSNGADISSFSSRENVDDIFNVFKFASDNSDVEWVVHRNDDTYTIGTKHDDGSAGGWKTYGLDKPQVSVHSHPGIATDMISEQISMGYGEGFVQKGNDWENVLNDVNRNGAKARLNYVYFPNSSRLYFVGYYNATYIRNINNYKKFYFGTLNAR